MKPVWLTGFTITGKDFAPTLILANVDLGEKKCRELTEKRRP